MTLDPSGMVALGALVLVVATLIANAYWQDAVRWDNLKYEALRSGNHDVADTAGTRVKRAKKLFRLATFLGLLVTAGIMVAFLSNQPMAIMGSRWLIFASLVLVVLALAYFTAAPRYFVPFETSVMRIQLHEKAEVMEDIALGRAVREGEQTEPVSKDEIFNLLKDQP